MDQLETLAMSFLIDHLLALYTLDMEQEKLANKKLQRSKTKYPNKMLSVAKEPRKRQCGKRKVSDSNHFSPAKAH